MDKGGTARSAFARGADRSGGTAERLRNRGGGGMDFTFGSVLQIIFKYVPAPPSVLAEHYVDRDRTLVYKWLRDSAFPPKKLLPDIVRFVTERSGETARGLLRLELERYIAETGLDPELRQSLAEKTDFREYLDGVFCLLAAGKTPEKLPKPRQAGEESPPPPPPPDWNPASYAVPPAATPRPAFSPAAEAPAAPDEAPDGDILHIRLKVSALIGAGLALSSAAAGEILWGVCAAALGWPGTPGALPPDAASLPAFFWGFLQAAPAVAAALCFPFGESGAAGRLWKILYFCGCALAGGLGSLLLAGSGLGRLAEGLFAAPALRGVFLAFVNAFILSFFPPLVLLALRRFPRTSPGAFLLLEFGPALLCLAAALPGLLTGELPDGQVWLGGFFPGFLLKICLYVSVRASLRERPGGLRPPYLAISRE